MCLTDEEKNITGYSIVLPLSADEHGLARMVMLVREGLNIKIQKNYMDKCVAAIWIKIGAAGRKPMNICGVYREHRFIYEGAPEDSGSDNNQTLRWFKFIESWKRAATSGDTMVLGDVNIDYCKWALPDTKHSRMVEKMKEELETVDFHQMVTDVTRSWSGQPDTLIDQCWVNAPQRINFYQEFSQKLFRS